MIFSKDGRIEALKRDSNAVDLVFEDGTRCRVPMCVAAKTHFWLKQGQFITIHAEKRNGELVAVEIHLLDDAPRPRYRPRGPTGALARFIDDIADWLGL